MEDDNRYIRFDWAAKRMLRDKANFDVLEGLMTVLIGEQVRIVEILESEGNQNAPDDKMNRVDVMARNSKGEYIIVEIQQTRELHYLERMLYGVSKVVTDNIRLGEKYDRVKKVYSINILYFPLGSGKDYVYHGTTRFIGLHTHDELGITDYEAETLGMRRPKDVFPEYYLIRVNEFNQLATTPLEEWLDYLKNAHIKADTTTPGLQEARAKLRYINMSESERKAYERDMENQMIQNDVLETAHKEGHAEGHAKGLAEGVAKGDREARIDMARNMKANNIPVEIIANCSGLTAAEIEKLF